MATAQRGAADTPGDFVGRTVGRFHIKSAVGAGGMGEVYLAEDTVLHREVAVKRLSPKLRTNPDARRNILREAQRASALNSPHIASVYDVVVDGDELLLVMEYVEGKLLRYRMRAVRCFERNEFLAIAVQCADALAAAHARGIIHRDIKPENIMLNAGGLVKVLDFGLARQVRVVDDSAVTVSVQSSDYAGTPGYMAPEVLREQEVDARADIFSLGVVFYEMLTGEHPFRAANAALTTDRVLHDQPQPLRKLVPSSPPDLERILAKMLAKEPGQRYATAADLLVDLRALQAGSSIGTAGRRMRLSRVAVIVVALLAGAAVFPSLMQRWPQLIHRPELPETKNVVVLPFINDDQNARAYSEGVAETLTAKLSQLTDRYPLQVVPPSDIRAQKVVSVDQARTVFGATLVLEGRVRQAGDKIRITYDLVDARAHRALRADTITVAAGDPFAVEDRIVDSVLRSLELELSASDRKALGEHGTSEPAAYDFYLQGRGYMQEFQNPENVDSAITVFNHALERDPRYALAYAGLGEAYWQKYQTTHNAEWVKKATEACEQATSTAAGHTCLGQALDATGQYEKAVTEFEQALRMDATSDDAYRGLARSYERLGRVADSEKTYREAIRLRPNYWAGYNALGTFLFRMGRFEDAIKTFSQLTMLAPDSFRAYNNLGAAYLAMGRYADAIPVFQRSVSIRPMFDAYSNLGTAFFYLRKYGDAADAYQKALQLDPQQYLLWGNEGDALFWGGKRGDARAAYQKALELASERLRVNPRDATPLSYSGYYKAMLGDASGAADSRDKSVELAPRDPEILFNAALATKQLGRTDAALAWLAKSIHAGYSPDLVRNVPNFDDVKSSPEFERALRRALR